VICPFQFWRFLGCSKLKPTAPKVESADGCPSQIGKSLIKMLGYDTDMLGGCVYSKPSSLVPDWLRSLQSCVGLRVGTRVRGSRGVKTYAYFSFGLDGQVLTGGRIWQKGKGSSFRHFRIPPLSLLLATGTGPQRKLCLRKVSFGFFSFFFIFSLFP
jgi:hypothetical protein